MKRSIKYRLKGNTIIEVIIAMAILTFCSALAVIIYLNIQKSTLPFFKIKAVELAEFYMKKTIEEKGFSDMVYEAEEFTVKRSASLSKEYPDCYDIRLIVFDGTKKKIHEIEQLMRYIK